MTVDAPARERCYLDGQWTETERWFEVCSPFDGKVLATVAEAGAEEARTAVDASVRAMAAGLPSWRRAEILERVAALIGTASEDLATCLSAESGKPLRAARVEVQRAAGVYAMSAAEARRLAGDVVPVGGYAQSAGHIAWTVRVPVGVVGAISPFNFPINLVAHKLAPALAAGCAVVLKPAEKTPLTALRLAALCADAGLPAGWLHVLPGRPAEIGDVFVDDDRVRLISFTGSSAVGWGLRSRAPRKRVLLELGNSSPVIVNDDADVELAATKVAAHAFNNAGQTCVSIQRVYVHRTVIDDFLTRLVPKVAALRVGDPLDETTDVGPVIDASSHIRILSWIDEAIAAGAKRVVGGLGEDGLIHPTVLTGVTPEMRICSQEVFGPVCSVMPFSSYDDALDAANATEYGLQASVFTRSIEPALQAVAKLEFGGVLINEAPEWRADAMPYGGVKASGNTKEGPAFAIREMTEERLVVLGGVDGAG